jgi:hypothetical protein
MVLENLVLCKAERQKFLVKMHYKTYRCNRFTTLLLDLTALVSLFIQSRVYLEIGLDLKEEKELGMQ